MDRISITQVAPDDLAALQEISQRTFFETFAIRNTEENMRQYLEENMSLERLATEMGTPGSEFYFALDGERVIGYLKLNSDGAQTELQDPHALEIERIYVSQEYHGKRVGQMLYEKAIEIAEERGLQYVWLGVWENNDRAVRFYTKNGFAPFDKHIFRLGDDEQTDIMMKKQLAY